MAYNLAYNLGNYGVLQSPKKSSEHDYDSFTWLQMHLTIIGGQFRIKLWVKDIVSKSWKSQKSPKIGTIQLKLGFSKNWETSDPPILPHRFCWPFLASHGSYENRCWFRIRRKNQARPLIFSASDYLPKKSPKFRAPTALGAADGIVRSGGR